MPNAMKTAMTIEKPVFEQMDAIAKQLNISRSRLFTIAAREFLQRHSSKELLERLNAAYADTSETEPAVDLMRAKHGEMVKDQW